MLKTIPKQLKYISPKVILKYVENYRQISMKHCADIHGAQRMNPADWGFPSSSPSRQQLIIFTRQMKSLYIERAPADGLSDIHVP